MRKIRCMVWATLVVILLIVNSFSVFAQETDEIDSIILEEAIVSEVIEENNIDTDSKMVQVIASSETNEKAIAIIDETSEDIIEISVIEPLTEDENGELVNSFIVEPNASQSSLTMVPTFNYTDVSVTVTCSFIRININGLLYYRPTRVAAKWTTSSSSSNVSVSSMSVQYITTGVKYSLDTTNNTVTKYSRQTTTISKTQSNPVKNTTYSQTGGLAYPFGLRLESVANDEMAAQCTLRYTNSSGVTKTEEKYYSGLMEYM